MKPETEKRKKDMVLFKNCLFLSFYSKERCEETEMDKTIVYNGGKLKEKCSDIEKAIILPSVREIGFEAFKNAKSLKSVVIPDGVESIGIDAFYGCESLEEILIPDSVISIGARAFWGCKNLKKVVLPSSLYDRQ